jgi:hypothetical protein
MMEVLGQVFILCEIFHVCYVRKLKLPVVFTLKESYHYEICLSHCCYMVHYMKIYRLVHLSLILFINS